MLDFGGGTFAPLHRPPARRRRRHPLRARRRTPDRGRGDRASSTGARPTSARNGIDSIETYRSAPGAGPRRRRVRRRLPGRRRLEHAARRLRRPRARAPAAGHARPHLRPAPRHRRGALGRLPRRDARPASAPGWSCGSATRWTPRSTARSPRWCPSGRPGRGLVQGKLHFLGALPRIDGDARRRHPRRRRRGPDQAGRRGLDRTGRPQAAAAARADRPRPDPRVAGVRRRRAGRDRGRGCCSASTRRSWRRSASTPTPSRTCWSSATASPARARVLRTYVQRGDAHPDGRRRPRSSSSTTGGRCSARCPRSTCSTTSPPPPRPAGAEGPRRLPREPDPRPGRHPRAAAQPVVVDRRRGLRARRRLRPGRHPAELAGRAAAAAAGPGPRRRPAPGRRPPLRWRVAGAVRAGDPVDARPGDARPAALRQPRRGSADRQRPAVIPSRPAAAGWSPATAASRSSSWPGPTRPERSGKRPTARASPPIDSKRSPCRPRRRVCRSATSPCLAGDGDRRQCDDLVRRQPGTARLGAKLDRHGLPPSRGPRHLP